MFRLISTVALSVVAVAMSGCGKSTEPTAGQVEAKPPAVEAKPLAVEAKPPAVEAATATATASVTAAVTVAAEQTVQVGCASCTYKMAGIDGCVTAAKIGDTAYLVTGGDLNAHKSGLCKAPKQAKIIGQVQDGKFVASSIKLIDE